MFVQASQQQPERNIPGSRALCTSAPVLERLSRRSREILQQSVHIRFLALFLSGHIPSV